MVVNPVASSIQVYFSAFFAGLCINSFKRRGLSSPRIISILPWLKKKDARKSVVEALQPRSIHLITMNVYSIASNFSEQSMTNDHQWWSICGVLCVVCIGKSNSRPWSHIFEGSSRYFAGQTTYLQTKTSPLEESNPVISGSSSQPSRKILTTKTLTSESEVTRRGLEHSTFVGERLGDTLEVKYGDKIEMIGKEVW